MEKKKVLYSTDSKDPCHEERKESLLALSKEFAAKESNRLNNEIEDSMKSFNSSYGEEVTLIHVRDFIDNWVDIIKPLIREGRDIICEKTPERSIYSLWESQTGNLTKGMLICEDAVDEKDSTPCLRPIYYTPALSPIYKPLEGVQNMELSTLYGELHIYKQNNLTHKFNSLYTDTVSKVNEHYSAENKEYIESISKTYNDLKEAWEKLFKFLEDYDSGNGSSEETSDNKEEVKQTKRPDLLKEDGLFEY